MDEENPSFRRSVVPGITTIKKEFDRKLSVSGNASITPILLSAVQVKHKELCLDLNMDAETIDASWKSYEEMSEHHILEGDQIHWLCCALYTACRNTITPTVAGPGAIVEGNYVSLTRLLRSCNINCLEFFNKMKRWMDMDNASKSFRDRIERLKSNLFVSLLVYQKYQTIFKGLFIGLQTDEPKKHKKTSRSQPCTSNKLYEFCWYLFLCAKSEYPNNSVDLVTTFHMLLCCVDLVFANALADKRRDLVNITFAKVPENWATNNGDSTADTTTKPMCVISTLCDLYNGTPIDAMVTKEYTWRSIIKKYIQNKVLKCDRQFLELLTIDHFDDNLNSVKKLYEAHVLSVGEIDEGILLQQMETSALSDTFQMEENKKQLMPDTPLTRRNCLPGKESNLEPVAMATQSVERLRKHLGKYEGVPPISLRELLSKCAEDPFVRIKKILGEMSVKFYANFETNAHERFQLAEAVYYRLLENILRQEMTLKKNFDWNIIKYDIFHVTLMTCSVEIVIYAYMAQKKFPWILECFSLDAYNFYKIIEMIALNHKDMLSRDVIKHLNAIEEQCIASLAWISSSQLWDLIAQCDSIPGREHADMPKQQLQLISDLSGVQPHNPNFQRSDPERNLLQSPILGASERFQQHSPGENVSKQLFKPTASESTATTSAVSTSNNNTGEDRIANGGSGSATGTPRKRGISGSMNLFFRKFYKLAYVRMCEICKHLNYSNETYLQKIWTIFEYSITKQYHLMQDRHLDQILMCAIYVFGRNGKFATTFKDIMLSYRKQPQTTSDVYRDVHMTASDRELDRESSNLERDANRKYDIIKFYNICYVRSMQEFVINTKDDGLLSPLPAYTNQLQSPRKISDRHSLYIQPFEPRDIPQSPNSLTYSFKSSPIEDLHKINRVVNQAIGLNSNGKRVLPFTTGADDLETTTPFSKLSRLTVSSSSNEPHVPYIREKLQKIITDRQGNN